MAITETSGFFNAEELDTGKYDREYDAEQFAQYFATFIGNGVFAKPIDQLRVEYKNDPRGAFKIIVKAGKAFIDGYWYWLKKDAELELPPNSGAYNINDSILLSLDKSKRNIHLEHKVNAGEGLPRNDGTHHDLVLALIKVRPGANKLYFEDFQDKRPEPKYCGFVTGVIDQIDASKMFEQLERQFNTWFQQIKDKLSTDQAGNLQLQVDELHATVTDTINDYEALDALETRGHLVDGQLIKQLKADSYQKVIEGTHGDNPYIYIKHDNGRAELYMSVYAKPVDLEAWKPKLIPIGSFPVEFKKAPFVHVSNVAINGSGFEGFVGSVDTVTASAIKGVYVMRSTKTSSATYTFSVSAQGFWK